MSQGVVAPVFNYGQMRNNLTKEMFVRGENIPLHDGRDPPQRMENNHLFKYSKVTPHIVQMIQVHISCSMCFRFCKIISEIPGRMKFLPARASHGQGVFPTMDPFPRFYGNISPSMKTKPLY